LADGGGGGVVMILTMMMLTVNRKDVKGSFFDGVMILSSLAIEDVALMKGERSFILHSSSSIARQQATYYFSGCNTLLCQKNQTKKAWLAFESYTNNSSY